MQIALASGKGGTGKTTLAVSLASVLAERGRPVTYVDCDVEEPNGHIFLKPTVVRSEPVEVVTPSVDPELCTACRRCSDFCRFNALVCPPSGVMVFDELCHGCGGCVLVCPERAIREIPRSIGRLDVGRAQRVGYVAGVLSVGEVRAVPVVRSVKLRIPRGGLAIVDCPPGTSCTAVEAVRDADHVVLVAEPTPFGLQDLRLAHTMVRTIELPVSVVINQCDIADSALRDYCRNARLEIIAEISHDRAVARACARGTIPTTIVPAFRDAIDGLADKIVGLADSGVNGEGTCSHKRQGGNGKDEPRGFLRAPGWSRGHRRL